MIQNTNKRERRLHRQTHRVQVETPNTYLTCSRIVIRKNIADHDSFHIWKNMKIAKIKEYIDNLTKQRKEEQKIKDQLAPMFKATV